LFGMGCLICQLRRGEANGRPHWRASRQSRPPEKRRPIRVAAKCGACFVALLGIVAQATTFVARLAFIRILPATQSAWDSFRGSIGSDKADGAIRGDQTLDAPA